MQLRYPNLQSISARWRSVFLALLFCFIREATAEEVALTNAGIYMETFLTYKKFSAKADVLHFSPGALKFRLAGNVYNHSGNFTIILDKPRERKKAFFSFGGAEKADYVVLMNVLSEPSVPLKDATIWERRKNFIVVEARGLEFIHSGSYTIQSTP